MNITGQINRYREAVRQTWNSFFLGLPDDVKFGEATEAFGGVIKLLFDALVLAPAAVDDQVGELGVIPFKNLKVTPQIASAVMLNRASPRTPYWDEPCPDAFDDAVFALMGVFDWDSYGFIECRYLMVRVMAWPSRPDLVDRDALVDAIYAKVECLP